MRGAGLACFGTGDPTGPCPLVCSSVSHGGGGGSGAAMQRHHLARITTAVSAAVKIAVVVDAELFCRDGGAGVGRDHRPVHCGPEGFMIRTIILACELKRDRCPKSREWPDLHASHGRALPPLP